MRRKVAILACGCLTPFVTATTAPTARAAAQHTVSIRADGRDELRISNGSLVVQHFSWSLPADLVVDGVPRPLSWNGNTSAPVAVPIAAADDYWVKKTRGRDIGYAVQRSGGFALAASDNPNGSDVYEFQLFAAPQSNTTDWMRVRGGGGTPGRMAFAGTPGYAPQPLGAETTFSLTVDGTDELMFVNGNLVIRHVSWSHPASLSINGVPQPLTFNGNLSNPIPVALPDGFQFTQLAGRTTLYPVETPVGLVIGADDELIGADVYSWKLSPVAASLPGDANFDDTVDLADFGILRQNFGRSGAGVGWGSGDFDGSGAVNLADFGILRANFGKGDTAAAAAAAAAFATIPEPASVGLLGLGGLALLACRRRA